MYKIELNMTYEAKVPQPVIVIMPPSFNYNIPPGTSIAGDITITNLSEFVSARNIVLRSQGSEYLELIYDLTYSQERGGYIIEELKAQETKKVAFRLLFKPHASPPPPICSQHCITTGATYAWHCDQTGRWVLVQVSSGTTHCVVSTATVRSQKETCVNYVNCPYSSPPCACSQSAGFIQLDENCCPYRIECEIITVECRPPDTGGVGVTSTVIGGGAPPPPPPQASPPAAGGRCVP